MPCTPPADSACRCSSTRDLCALVTSCTHRCRKAPALSCAPIDEAPRTGGAGLAVSPERKVRPESTREEAMKMTSRLAAIGLVIGMTTVGDDFDGTVVG